MVSKQLVNQSTEAGTALESDNTLIKVENVTKIFRLGLLGKTTIKALDRVNLDLKKGEILGVLGESGSGKSTLARIILNIYKPTSGRVLYNGKDIREFKGVKGLREYYRYVQGVFQDPYSSFNPRRRVLSVLMDVINNYYPGLSLDEKTRLIRETLEHVGMNYDEIIGRYPHEFSGGQLQRLSIARALLVKPNVIIADEPVSMVDASTRIEILNIFIDLKESEGISLIIIGHDFGLTRYVSDRVVVMYKGQIVEQGDAELLQDPLHPYTKMLAESIPRIDKKWSGPLQYSAESLELGAKGTGCVFADRCPYRMDICVKQEPPEVDMGKSKVKCWLYAKK